jgi:hypothetical protein
MFAWIHIQTSKGSVVMGLLVVLFLGFGLAQNADQWYTLGQAAMRRGD